MTKLDYFVNGYMKADDKIKYCNKHIIRTYLKYEEKIAEANKIVELAHHVEKDGVKSFRKNSPLLYQLYVLRVLVNYTDIEISEINAAEDFNALNRIGAVEDIFSSIPEREIRELQTVLRMVEDDLMENERSFAGWLDGKMELIGVLLDAINQDNNIENEV